MSVEVAKRSVVIAEPSVPYDVDSTVGGAERSVTPEVDGIVEIPDASMVTGSPSGPVDAAEDIAITDDVPVATPGSMVEPCESVLRTPFCARLKLIELEPNSNMDDDWPLVGTKVVSRLLSPRGRPVIRGGGITLELSSTSEPAVVPSPLVLTTETFDAKVAFVTFPGVEIVVIAVGSPNKAVVVIELEMPSSLVATEDDTEVTIVDPAPDSRIGAEISNPTDDRLEPVVSNPLVNVICGSVMS